MSRIIFYVYEIKLRVMKTSVKFYSIEADHES